jgi:hypothetical protein
MGLKFTSLPKSRNFKIATRFYDPQKEAIKEREERIKREIAENNGIPGISNGAGIKGQFRNSGKYLNNRTGAEARRNSNLRLLYIVLLLLALFYFILK